MLFIQLFLFIFLFEAALFYGYSVHYEKPINSAVIWAGIILFLLSIYYFYNWKIEEMRDFMTAWVWAIPVCYLTPVSAHHAAFMVRLSLLYGIFFGLAAAFAREKRGAALIQQGIVFAGYTAVIYCYMNMFGNAYHKDAVMLTGEGLRLTSVFQYANAYAAYLLAILLCAVWMVMRSRKWYAVLLHATMVVPTLLSFFLTLSRGGLVMLPVIVLLVLPFYRFVQQISFFVYLLAGSFAALLIVEPVKELTTSVFNR
ncbi:hypothetical protein [Paenibacillus xerothermodurans]|nr:hypothetical protein [Paenibacillus xerothermodurans]